MTAASAERLILEGIRGLPADCLAEIADFIYFVRKRVLQPEAFAEELRDLAIRAELKNLSRAEQGHLEEEFDDYDRRHPKE